jgi:chromate transport protein ChrA
MFFGCLAGGRLGAIAAGLGFILPGFILMLVASYLYVVVGFGNVYFDASFRALQPIVATMVSRIMSLTAGHGSLLNDILRTTDPSRYAQDL